jgi:hypothetical protein
MGGWRNWLKIASDNSLLFFSGTETLGCASIVWAVRNRPYIQVNATYLLKPMKLTLWQCNKHKSNSTEIYEWAYNKHTFYELKHGQNKIQFHGETFITVVRSFTFCSNDLCNTWHMMVIHLICKHLDYDLLGYDTGYFRPVICNASEKLAPFIFRVDNGGSRLYYKGRSSKQVSLKDLYGIRNQKKTSRF